MHVLANWIAELVQFLYCSITYHVDCNSGPFYTSSGPFCAVYIVDLFIHSSGPFSDWGGGGGGSSEPREPPYPQILLNCMHILLWDRLISLWKGIIALAVDIIYV